MPPDNCLTRLECSFPATVRLWRHLHDRLAARDLNSWDPTDLQLSTVGNALRHASRRFPAIRNGLGLLEIGEALAPIALRRQLSMPLRVAPICAAQVGISLSLVNPSGSTVVAPLVDTLWSLRTERAHGPGWGLPFAWESAGGSIPALTPCHTQTFYAWWLLRRENQAALPRIAQHTLHDFLPAVEPCSGRTVTGYSTADRRIVYNALSYRARILVEASDLGLLPANAAADTLDALLAAQHADGRWFYGSEERFVDHYHTAFVLRNLHAIRHADARIPAAFDRGLAYYDRHLFDSHGLPIPFAAGKRALHRRDLYDFAEAIHLYGAIHRRTDVERLARWLLAEGLTASGELVARRYPGLAAKGPGYLRYATTAVFLGLSVGLAAG